MRKLEQFKQVNKVTLDAFQTSTRQGTTSYFFKPVDDGGIILLGAINEARKIEGKAEGKTISQAQLNEIMQKRFLTGNPLTVNLNAVNNLSMGTLLKPNTEYHNASSEVSSLWCECTCTTSS